MRIVLLIRRRSHMVYLANRVHKHAGLVGVVIENHVPSLPGEPLLTRVGNRVRKEGIGALLLPFSEKIRATRHRRKMGKQYFANIEKYRDEYFGNEWKELDPTIPVITTSSINNSDTANQVAALKPDLILCQGTSIVSDEVIHTAPLALNLHWGLSPYYRGTHCTEWALLNWDPYNIGVTIHKLCSDIDGGGVVAQQRAEIHEDHSTASINMQLTRMGADLLCSVVDELKKGSELQYHAQDFSQGFLYYLRQWQPELATAIEDIELTKMGKMLKNPAREERLPIVSIANSL